MIWCICLVWHFPTCGWLGCLFFPGPRNAWTPGGSHAFFRGMDFEQVLRREVQVPPIRSVGVGPCLQATERTWKGGKMFPPNHWPLKGGPVATKKVWGRFRATTPMVWSGCSKSWTHRPRSRPPTFVVSKRWSFGASQHLTPHLIFWVGQNTWSEVYKYSSCVFARYTQREHRLFGLYRFLLVETTLGHRDYVICPLCESLFTNQYNGKWYRYRSCGLPGFRLFLLPIGQLLNPPTEFVAGKFPWKVRCQVSSNQNPRHLPYILDFTTQLQITIGHDKDPYHSTSEFFIGFFS